MQIILSQPNEICRICFIRTKIITSRSVSDYFNYEREIDNIHDYKKFILKNTLYDRDKVANFYKLKLSRESFIKTFKNLYE